MGYIFYHVWLVIGFFIDQIVRIATYLRYVIYKHTHGLEITHWTAHCAYFLAVAIEGHGMYAMMGGMLFVLTLIMQINGE